MAPEAASRLYNWDRVRAHHRAWSNEYALRDGEFLEECTWEQSDGLWMQGRQEVPSQLWMPPHVSQGNRDLALVSVAMGSLHHPATNCADWRGSVRQSHVTTTSQWTSPSLPLREPRFFRSQLPYAWPKLVGWRLFTGGWGCSVGIWCDMVQEGRSFSVAAATYLISFNGPPPNAVLIAC